MSNPAAYAGRAASAHPLSCSMRRCPSNPVQSRAAWFAAVPVVGTLSRHGDRDRDNAGLFQGPGVSATTITIGYNYTSNGDAGNAAIGAAVSQGDEVGEAKAIRDDINSHGGVAGRNLQIVFHPYDATSQQTNDTQDASDCARVIENELSNDIVIVDLCRHRNIC
ncbi:MAG: hypothetical protein NVS3B26_22450 [Mycobacteriales bacterium]